MKTLPANLVTALSSGKMGYFILVFIDSPDGAKYYTSLPYDVVVDPGQAIGSQTWISDGGLSEVTTPKQSQVIDKETYQLKFVDNADEWRNVFETYSMHGRYTIIFYGSIDLNTNVANLTDLGIAYKGKIDSVATNNSWLEKEAIVNLASPMADFELTRPRITSKDGQDQIDDTDTAFDEIYQGAKEINIKWGKV